MKKIKTRILVCFFFVLGTVAMAQTKDRFDVMKEELAKMEETNPGLKDPVDVSVNETSVQEFLRAIANVNKLNISVDPELDINVVNSFSRIPVSDVLVFLCKQYSLDISFTGSIMYFTKYKEPSVAVQKFVPKKLEINYSSQTDKLDLDLKNDSLYAVVKEITRASGKNVVIAPDLLVKTVTVYVKNMDFNEALDNLAFSNDIKVVKSNNSYMFAKQDGKVVLEDEIKSKNNGTKNQSGKEKGNQSANKDLNISVDKEKLTVVASNVSIKEIIEAVSDELGYDYFLFSDPKGTATLNVSGVTYFEFLNNLLNGTDYTYKVEDGIFLIGDRKLEKLRDTRVVHMQNRTITKMLEVIPTEMQKGVEIKNFPDLNSIILSGSQPQIIEIESFLRSIDQVVPMVLIEVMIVDYKVGTTVATGISAGIGEAPATTGGTVFPKVDFTLNSNSLNNLIASFNGFGWFNLGNVTPNFYVSLKALEEQGILRTRSTPKLATLNGNEATLSIGNTEYYLEIQNNVIGAQNPQNIISQQYKAVKADLSVSINPMVSGDDQVTLDITVKQSDFTTRISPNAPPGNVNREFKSIIRVKNQEMVILGGLEEKSTNDTGSGVPLLSRIPIIKWFFSSRNRTAKKTRLNIFIKPTIIY